MYISAFNILLLADIPAYIHRYSTHSCKVVDNGAVKTLNTIILNFQDPVAELEKKLFCNGFV